MEKMRIGFFVVVKGGQPGIYNSWPACQAVGGDMDANPKALTFQFSRADDAIDFYQRYKINNPPAPKVLQQSDVCKKVKQETPALDATDLTRPMVTNLKTLCKSE